ncbi:hypothetical protein PPERSA_06258 [Pseudocohnilembus persalinus]|uniref:Uncharacterized protein n=1 Tax=Pseudocohnilembus persalinus TaxID=266149 RepID=A0A0V0QVD0_PSEPJ|nr:hypothetical protein PPERSA_06258 [Pseudocohnilembus persalinus]|eukprot:KRX06287.1 hypothetical protein PPERSA_06258 [Pseudocohnilembus persalinus]
MQDYDIKNVDISKFQCPLHQQQVVFVCNCNNWHCEQESNTNYGQIQVKIYEQIKDIQSRLNFQEIEEDENLMNLRKWKQMIYQQINEQFILIEEWYKEMYQELEKQKKNSLEELSQTLNGDYIKIKDNFNGLKKLIQEQSKENSDKFKFNEELQKSLKYILNNGENLQEKVEKIKSEVDFIYNQKIGCQLNLNQDVVQQLLENVKKLVNKKELEQLKKEEKNLGQKQQQGQKQNRVFKTKKHLCPFCNTQMIYLSDFKKHLTCPNCQEVKRNYNQKSISNNNKGRKIF